MRRFHGLASLAAILALCVTTAAFAQQPEKKRLAIGEPRTDWAQSGSCHGFAPRFGSTVAAALQAKIGETGAFRMLSRSQIASILKEHSLSMNGMGDPNNAKQVGKFLQADYLLNVEFLCLPDYLQINIMLVDTETAEDVFTKGYEMRDQRKLDVMTKDVAKMLKTWAKTGEVPGGSKASLFQMIDARAFHDSTEKLIAMVRREIPRAAGKITEVNTYGESIKVKLSYGSDVMAGLKLKVKRDEEELGTVFIKKKGRGELEAGTTDDMSAFEEGDLVTTEGWEPMFALARTLEDEEGANEEFAEAFMEKLEEEFPKVEGIQLADSAEVKKVLQRMGPKADKNSLAKLQKAGVDFLLIGRIVGAGDDRQIRFDALNTFDGKRVVEQFVFAMRRTR